MRRWATASRRPPRPTQPEPRAGAGCRIARARARYSCLLLPQGEKWQRVFSLERHTRCIGFRPAIALAEGSNLTSGASSLDFSSEETALRSGANTNAMHARRAVMHLLLALFLLLSQQAGFAHAATHLASDPASQDRQLPHSKVCDQCVQGAQLGAALVDTSPDASWFSSCGAHGAAAPVRAHLPRPLLPFCSRAPPV